jgi:hypothetical protein
MTTFHGASRRNIPLVGGLAVLIATLLVLAAGVVAGYLLAGAHATGVTRVCAETCAPKTTPRPAAVGPPRDARLRPSHNSRHKDAS